MRINMKEALEKWLVADRKKAMPILSFPIAQKMGLTVTELLNDADTQAKGLKMLYEEVDAGAVLTYMDLSVEAEAFGGTVVFCDEEVPNVPDPIVETKEDVEALKVPEVGAGRTDIYVDGCRKAVELINDPEVPVLAGCIGPFSLAGRVMDLTTLMMNTKRDPDTVHVLLDKCTEFIIKYAQAYKDVGANGIAMAEPLAGLMRPNMLKEFSSDYVKRIVNAVQDDYFSVIYHNCGESAEKSISEILETGSAAYHFGNAINMTKVLDAFPADIIAMGNVDPAAILCNGTPEMVRESTLEVMRTCSKYKNFIISSGCDVPAHSPWENLYAFFDAVDEFYENN